MKFFTVQSIPNNGFDKTLLTPKGFPIDPRLGFRPLWAVPLTTYKDTLASLLLIAPNEPMTLHLIECEEYHLVDKLKWYQNISAQKEEEIPFVDKTLLDEAPFKYEALLDRDSEIKVLETIIIPPIIEVTKDYSKIKDLFAIHPFKEMLSEEIVRELGMEIAKQLNKLPKIDKEETIKHQKLLGVKNAESLFNRFVIWRDFKFSFLLMYVYGYFHSNFTRDDGVQVRSLSTGWLNTIKSIHKASSLEQEFANWSHGDCANEEVFLRIFEELKNLIIEEDSLLESISSGVKIGRNAPCPCGSGFKYKKCHG